MESDHITNEAASQYVRSKITFFNNQIRSNEEMESDHITNEAASQYVRSKITFFNNQIRSNESSQTNKKSKQKPPIPQRPRPPPSISKLETTACQVSSKDIATEEIMAESFRQKFVDELRAKIDEVAERKRSAWSPNDMEIFKRPMCLISTDKSDVLTLSTEVVSQIEMIDWPMVVVSIVGPYSTGKSYLMNRLAQSATGFSLRDTTEAKTKGIWAWCKIHPEMRNTVLLLLDTEGLGDVEQGDASHDNKIFSLVALLCNCLVFDVKGDFDQDAVEKLSLFVTEMANNVRYRGESSKDNQTLNLILPDFVLCVQDFSLELSKNGAKFTEDEYLEQSLAEQKGKEEKYNEPRKCIKKYFPQRRCFTFPEPGEENVQENLETLRFDQLSSQFQEATSRFISYIYSTEPKKLVASKPVNGLSISVLQ